MCSSNSYYIVVRVVRVVHNIMYELVRDMHSSTYSCTNTTIVVVLARVCKLRIRTMPVLLYDS